MPLVDGDKTRILDAPLLAGSRVMYTELPDRAFPVKDDFAQVPVESKICRVGPGDGREPERRPKTWRVIATAFM